jgi:hypothetical protein
VSFKASQRPWTGFRSCSCVNAVLDCCAYLIKISRKLLLTILIYLSPNTTNLLFFHWNFPRWS